MSSKLHEEEKDLQLGDNSIKDPNSVSENVISIGNNSLNDVNIVLNTNSTVCLCLYNNKIYILLHMLIIRFIVYWFTS